MANTRSSPPRCNIVLIVDEAHRSRKGVFITTSTYTQQAITYVSQLRDSKIILIDGQKLAQFMIEHDVRVSIKETLYIKRIDEDFFADADF